MVFSFGVSAVCIKEKGGCLMFFWPHFCLVIFVVAAITAEGEGHRRQVGAGSRDLKLS
jgi:hypothetical protein